MVRVHVLRGTCEEYGTRGSRRALVDGGRESSAFIAGLPLEIRAAVLSTRRYLHGSHYSLVRGLRS